MIKIAVLTITTAIQDMKVKIGMKKARGTLKDRMWKAVEAKCGGGVSVDVNLKSNSTITLKVFFVEQSN